MKQKLIKFVGNVRTPLVLSKDKKENDFFSQIFPTKLFDYIADETNKLQQQKGQVDGTLRQTLIASEAHYKLCIRQQARNGCQDGKR